jgi:Zn-dependent peptidase ImmA (M78 family)/DNA-binding XRE family transcriptional regulator
MTLISRRLKAAREAAGLTQQQLSDQLGFKDRQTLAAIEAGTRKVSAEELIKIMRILDKDLEYFTDPFRLDGESNFIWRAADSADEHLGAFEARAGRWLALYRTLKQEQTDTSWWSSPLGLNLTSRSTYEEAHFAAEWLAAEWELGDNPAGRLEDAIREHLRALVLHVDAPEGISGAAFRLPEFHAILVNRTEPEGRRNFDLAHELFHLLTWETIKPAHTEWGMINPKGRPEQLANCFASALLMPEKTVRSWMGEATDAAPRLPVSHAETWRSWLNDRAYSLRVSTPALQWRMVQIGLLNKKDVDPLLDWWSDPSKQQRAPLLFSQDYMRVLHAALSSGKLSVRRAAGVLDMTIDQLAALFTQYNLDVPFDI